uniref:Transcription factor E2F7 n=1 Tax=Hucho hucho TaxID=62062 RepID=A0A4W5PFU4_9TELE
IKRITDSNLSSAKVRRLYDIANVLTSLGLIKKVHVREERGRKPAFKWIGPAHFHTSHEDSEAVAAITLPGAIALPGAIDLPGGRKQKLARHASFSVVPTSVASQRRVNSAPSSPRREVTGLLPQSVDYSRRCVSNSAVCRLQFGTTVTG